MDLQVIANRIATTIGTVVATNGTETETLTATADLPDAVGKAALVVYLPVGALGLDLGPRLDDHWTFPVMLLRDPLSTAARGKWLYAWATALRTRIQSNIDLNLTDVVANATFMRVEIGGERGGQPYPSVAGGSANFDVVELTVDVHVYELTTASM